MAALAAAAVAALAWKLGNDYYLRILFMMCVYYLCAAGMNVLVGYAGQKSLGQAGLFAAGAYTAALLTSRFAVDPWIALAAAAVVSGVFGVLIALPSLRVKGPYLAMVTLAFGIVVEKLVTEWTDFFGGPQGLYGIKPLGFGGVPLTSVQWAWFGILLCLVTHLLLRNLLRGRFGRALLSLQADEIASASVGVHVYRYKVLAFVIAAVTCGIAGALVAQQNQYINSDFISFHLSIFILLLVLFGGVGMLYGPLVGAVLLVLIDALLAQWPSVQHFVYGALLLFALYAMPRGVAGLFAGWFRPRQPAAPAKTAARRPFSMQAPACAGLLLEVADVCKSYGGVRPAQDVCFRLEAGHIHALIGPNGAGKSTMINMLTGVIDPDQGRIRFLGTDIGGQPIHDICRRGVGRTFQNLRLFTDLSVLDNVLLGRHCRMTNGFWASLLALPSARRAEADACERALAILDLLDLAEVAYAPAGSLPYGLQRRVELARSLATEPQLLLLDEPAAGLNPQETADLGQLLVRISKLGITILMVEHHMDLVMSISDHITVLDYGIKIAEGTPAAVQANPAVIAAYLGAAVTDDMQEERAC
ncbi:MAG: branched-chain amino acid ABC transporter ATP-binding protein/permease [Pseudomonadota bacterium]